MDEKVSAGENPQILAQFVHFFLAYSIVLTAASLAHSKHWSAMVPITVTGVGIVVATLKEFWYDLAFEVPKQTVGDSFEDWAFYMAGGFGAWIFVAASGLV